MRSCWWSIKPLPSRSKTGSGTHSALNSQCKSSPPPFLILTFPLCRIVILFVVTVGILFFKKQSGSAGVARKQNFAPSSKFASKKRLWLLISCQSLYFIKIIMYSYKLNLYNVCREYEERVLEVLSEPNAGAGRDLGRHRNVRHQHQRH